MTATLTPEQKAFLESIEQEQKQEAPASEPKTLQELKEEIDKIKSEYIQTMDECITLQNKVQVLKDLDTYISDEQVPGLQEAQEKHENLRKQIDVIKSELMKLTEGPFYIREEALNTIYNLDNVRNGKYVFAKPMQ